LLAPAGLSYDLTSTFAVCDPSRLISDEPARLGHSRAAKSKLWGK
jgi:hypothetical protein